MCGIFVDEVSQEFRRERKAASEKLLEATELALPIVQAITADDATADLNPEAVEQLLGIFQERVTQALALEERIHPTALHAWLKEAITSVIRCAIRTCILPLWPEDAVRSHPPGTDHPSTTAEPEFYRISDPLQTDNFLGSGDPELEGDYNEAILLRKPQFGLRPIFRRVFGRWIPRIL
eukprot:s723_g3.t1